MSTTAEPQRLITGTVLVLGGLYLSALAIRLVAASQLPFPATEPSAYFAAVAESLVHGEGLVSHGVWSYATPPHVVPKPAFELWLPLSSLVSAAVMAVLGPSWWAAQVGGAILGALVAPLAWAVAHAAARTAALDARRSQATALAAGILAAILGPLVLGAAVPDSTTPFTIFAVIAALLIPRVLGEPSRRAGLALGLALGLAYLSRQEVIWMGLTVLLMIAWVLRSRPAGSRVREGAERLWPVVVGGLVVVVPWLLRNLSVFGSVFPGQAVENMFLVRNEDIFAFAERPSAARYLDQGLATVLWNPVSAAWDGIVNVLLVPAFPIGLAGLIALLGMRHSPALRHPTALVALLVSGGITFCATALLFPVATRWGTFLHASGPLLVGLIVVTVLGTDALLARVSRVRHWSRPNVVLGPIAIVTVAALLGVVQLGLLSRQAGERQRQMEAVAWSLRDVAEREGLEVPATLITDRPMWLADVLERDAVALPDEGLAAIMQLSRQFAAPWVVIIDERGRYPAALREETARGCLVDAPVELSGAARSAWLFRLAEACLTA